MAKQGRWILKNVRHDKPGVTIPSASLGLQSKTINLGSVTSNKKSDITTEVFTDLGVHLNLNNITKNPTEGSTFVQGGLTYKVHWVLTEKPQPEPEPEPVITYRLRITDAPENCLPYNGVAQFDAILEKYIDGVHDESSDLLVTSESEWSFISGGDYVTRNPAGSNKFIITGNNTTDSVQTVGIKVEYNGQSNVQPATTSVCFNPEEVPVERDIKISTNKIDAVCEDNDLYVVTVTATNVDWTVTVAQNAQSWLSVQDITSDSFKVKVLDFDGARRSGTITVYSTTEDTNISRTVTVTQEDCEPAPVVPKLEVSVSSIDALCKNNQTSAVTVTAENTEWTVTKCNTCSWITISNISSNGFSISVSDSTENERTGIVTVASTTPGVNITREITVSQPDCRETPEPYLRYTTNLEVCETNKYCIDCDDSTTYTVTVESNVEWTAGTSDAWINITNVTDSGFKVSFVNNEGDDRSGTITIWTEDRSLSSLDKTLSIKQYKCPDIPVEDDITADVDSLEFECPGDSAAIHISTTGDGVTWTATTNDSWITITNPSSTEITVTVNGENRTRRNKEGTVTITSNISGKEPIEVTIIQKPTMFFTVSTNTVSFDENGGTVEITAYTNYPFTVNVPSEHSSWLSATRSQNTGNNTAWTVTLTATANASTTDDRSASVSFTTDYSGNCEWGSMPSVSVEQDKAEPYIPPVPDAYFDVEDIYGDFPYYAELGGYTHEYSLMDEEFYSSCGLSDGDVGGVVYLMPVRACAIQVYYDTNVDITGLTYEIEHISPANPSQEWLEVVMDPEEYGCMEEYPEMECGWSEVDSRDEPYPGDFILIKTRDSFEGSDLYKSTYTGYVHIKEKATGKVLRTIPVKCIEVDINSESVKVSDSENGSRKSKITIGSNDNPAVGAVGGFVDVWVYTNDSAYFSDHPDDDVSWNNLTFYYEDGETRIPVTPAQDPSGMGYIDKIYDTRCNANQLLHVKVKVGPNCQYTNVERGFELSTENAGYLLIDGGNEAEVKIIQARNQASASNYRIEEFFAISNEMTPVWDNDHPYGGEYKYITGATCDGTGHTINPTIKILYDEAQSCNPGVITPKEPLNDNRVIYDETVGHNIANPSIIEANIQYTDGSSWIIQNQNYNATTGQPFEFYLQPYTGYTDSDGGKTERTALITVTYKNCAPQITRQLRITQSYKKVEMEPVNMKLYSGGSPYTAYVDAATGTVSSNGYVIINNQGNNYIYLAGEEGVTVNVVITNSTACTFESITDSNGSQAGQNYMPYILASNWCELFIKNTAPAGTNYTITINCTKTGKTTKTLTINVQV